MNEVACRALEIVVNAARQKGIADDEVVASSGVSYERLRHRKERIDWSQFCAIMRNLRAHITDDEYVELGRKYMRSRNMRFAFVIARLVFSPLDIYRWFSKPRAGVGNQMFNCVVPNHRELSATEIVLELTLPEEYEVCWEFFVISSGNMEELPCLFGLPRAKLLLTRIARGARMEITLPTDRLPLLRRFLRVLTSPFAARAAARELKDAHETLVERYDQLEAARLVLARQATQLRTAHTINQLAQRDLELERMLQTVTQALVRDAGFGGAELALSDRSQSAAAGSFDHPRHVRSLTGRLGQTIAELAVSSSDDATANELLDFVVPGLSIALENALYKSGLERLVEQRTHELRQAHDQLAGTVDQLREAQGARERFFGNISHEIRTPLSIIMLAASELELRTQSTLDANGRARFGVITDASRKLVRLVDELLLLAAGHENKLVLKPEPTDLVALMRQLEVAWTPMAVHAGLRLTTRLPARAVANVDPTAIDRVVTNLISNAVKYTPRGGEVIAELVTDANGIRLSVLDTGPGIDSDLAGRLFGRFERGMKRQEIGTGIGLALAKQLVDGHNGTIEAVARPEGGTEMRVTLPATLLIDVDTPVVQRAIGAASSASVPGELVIQQPTVSRGTVLLVEDDVQLAAMVAQLLSTEFSVIVTHDGVAALDAIKSHHPQMLVTDVDMPGLNGIELARLFRERSDDRLAPVVILSAVLDLNTRVAGLEAGATDYVCKPFDPVELMARVRAQFRMRDLAVRLHRAEQMSTMGILTSGLAHELRNPANGIVNALPPIRELLPVELKKGHPVGELLDVIGECADQINHLAKQLLGFRRGEAVDTRWVVARELVGRSASLCQTSLTGRTLIQSVPDTAMVNCAPPLIVQVLVNLLENAAHAAGSGGTVWLTVHTSERSFELVVSDSGPGVPPQLRDRVFEAFFTTKDPGVGTGLGLTLSRDIVQRHGGTLEIQERGGKPVFVISLPQPMAASSRASARDALSQPDQPSPPPDLASAR